MAGISSGITIPTAQSTAYKPVYKRSVPTGNEEERADSKDELKNNGLKSGIIGGLLATDNPVEVTFYISNHNNHKNHCGILKNCSLLYCKKSELTCFFNVN